MSGHLTPPSSVRYIPVQVLNLVSTHLTEVVGGGRVTMQEQSQHQQSQEQSNARYDACRSACASEPVCVLWNSRLHVWNWKASHMVQILLANDDDL